MKQFLVYNQYKRINSLQKQKINNFVQMTEILYNTLEV